MTKMIVHAQGDSTQINEIQSKQLIGIEYQSHILALAVSNMFIHQDSKTNIINGSCFDDKIVEKIKKSQPTNFSIHLINRIKRRISMNEN